MNENKRFALVASLFSLVGLPAIFLTVSLYTGNWLFFLFSIAPSLASGLTGLMITKQNTKKDESIV